jgi:hypothetical protein
MKSGMHAVLPEIRDFLYTQLSNNCAAQRFPQHNVPSCKVIGMCGREKELTEEGRMCLQASLPEVNSSVKVAPPGSPWYKNMWSYCGLGFIISVGYSDSSSLP